MVQIPLSKIPSQTLTVTLDGQYCRISLYWRQIRMYMDLVVDDIPICYGAICLNYTSVTQFPTNDFRGSLHFIDKLGDTAPHWEYFNDRYAFVYYADNEDLPLELSL